MRASLGPTDWQVDIKGNTLTFTSTSRVPNRSFTLDLKALQPDGSGKGVGKDDKNREFYLTFDPERSPPIPGNQFHYLLAGLVFMPKA